MLKLLQLYLLQNAWFQLSSMNFQNFSGEELTEPPPQTPSPHSISCFVLGIICTRSFHFSPEYTKIVSGWGSAPDPAGGAYSAPPDPLAVMGWDGDLVTTFLGCKLCAPLCVVGAPLLLWSWLRAWYNLILTWSLVDIYLVITRCTDSPMNIKDDAVYRIQVIRNFFNFRNLLVFLKQPEMMVK